MEKNVPPPCTKSLIEGGKKTNDIFPAGRAGGETKPCRPSLYAKKPGHRGKKEKEKGRGLPCANCCWIEKKERGRPASHRAPETVGEIVRGKGEGAGQPFLFIAQGRGGAQIRSDPFSQTGGGGRRRAGAPPLRARRGVEVFARRKTAKKKRNVGAGGEEGKQAIPKTGQTVPFLS